MILDEGDGPCLAKLLYLMVDMKVHIFLRADQGLNILAGRRDQEQKKLIGFCGPSRYLISKENSRQGQGNSTWELEKSSSVHG